MGQRGRAGSDGICVDSGVDFAGCGGDRPDDRVGCCQQLFERFFQPVGGELIARPHPQSAAGEGSRENSAAETSADGRAGAPYGPAGKGFSVLQPLWKGIEKFQPDLPVPVRTDISGPDHHAVISGRRVIRLQEGDCLAGSQRCISLNSGPKVGKVNRRPFVKGFGAIGLNHQNNGFSDGFPL